jgi:hypothetical protein
MFIFRSTTSEIYLRGLSLSIGNKLKRNSRISYNNLV